MRKLAVAGWVIFFVLNLPLARANDATGEEVAAGSFSTLPLFERGRYEAAVNSGALFSPFIANGNRPVINYALSEVQFGYMLSDVKGANLFRGNFELIGEGFGSAIFQGSGSYIAGVTLWGRYNFVPPASRIVPFAQAGAGLSATDIDRQIVGQVFNFNLDVGVGFRWFIAQKWALNLEYRYQHVSNANTGHHNIGINAHGPMLGLSYFF